MVLRLLEKHLSLNSNMIKFDSLSLFLSLSFSLSLSLVDSEKETLSYLKRYVKAANLFLLLKKAQPEKTTAKKS